MCRIRQLPVLEVSSTDESSPKDEGAVSTHNHKKQLKPCKLRTADLLVVHRVLWPHELVYTAEGQPTVYDTISVALFVNGYMQAMEAEKPAVRPLMGAHRVELMDDAEMYCCECIPCLSCCLVTSTGAWPCHMGGRGC